MVVQGGAWLTLPASDIDLLGCDRPRDDGRCYALNHLRSVFGTLRQENLDICLGPFLGLRASASPRSRTDVGVLVHVPGPNDGIKSLL